MNCFFINTGQKPARFNMELDLRLATKVFEEVKSPILRLYGWNPPAISIGYNQSFEYFNLKKLAANGIDIIRRPTGGQAILHVHELTYSVVMPLDKRGPRDIYRSINECLLAGIRLLGINGQLVERENSSRDVIKYVSSASCFSNSVNSELQVNHKKIIGSAQRRFGSVILQQGSFLLDSQHLHILEYLSSHQDYDAELSKLMNNSIDAKTILKRSVDFNEAAEAIMKGFMKTWEVTFENIPFEFEEVYSTI